MSDLSEFRVVGGRAFKAAGVDLCCPVYTSTSQEQRDDQELHQYNSLCSIKDDTFRDFTRSIYSCQGRLIARRGILKLIVSDNGKTFKRRALKQFNARQGIKWRYDLS